MSKWDIPDNINFAGYESPIQRIIEDAHNRIIKEEAHQIMMRVSQAVGYEIDKEELLKALLYDRGQYAKGYAAGLNADRWISVEDRLPEEGEEVLVWYEYFRYGNYNRMFPDYGIGFHYKGNWSVIQGGVNQHVFAWQELPKPYEKAGEEE